MNNAQVIELVYRCRWDDFLKLNLRRIKVHQSFTIHRYQYVHI